MKLHLPLSIAIAAALLASPPLADAAKAKPRVSKQVVAKKKHKATQKIARAKPTSRPVAKAAVGPTLNLPPQTITGRPTQDMDEWLTAGDHRFTIQHEGLTRSYLVHVPQRYDPTEITPMLVALNGYRGAVPPGESIDSVLRESDHQGFIAVVPQAYGGKGRQPAWSAGQGAGQPVNDVSFIAKVVHNVFRQATVDRGRIYAAGVADGGTMAYRLACDLPNVFRGVASVGGVDTSTNCKQGNAVSVFHLQAQNDTRVPFSAAPMTTARWAQANGCELAPRKVLIQDGAYCEAYTYCRNRTAVEMCATETGGQSWAGTRAKSVGGPPLQVVDGTGSLWAFLRTH